jgi:hypothetical protein
MSVGIDGDDPQLLAAAERHLPFVRRHSNRHDFRVGRIAEWHAGGNPVSERLQLTRAFTDPNPAAMRGAPRSLRQQEAAIRRYRKDTPPAGLLRQSHIVGTRIEAENRQLESILPFGLAVAAGRITAEPAQERNDVIFEIESPRR